MTIERKPPTFAEITRQEIRNTTIAFFAPFIGTYRVLKELLAKSEA